MQPEGQDEEFYCTGRVELIEDATVRAAAAEAAEHAIHDVGRCVEFLIERVLQTTWNDWGTPKMSPNHVVWSA